MTFRLFEISSVLISALADTVDKARGEGNLKMLTLSLLLTGLQNSPSEVVVLGRHCAASSALYDIQYTFATKHFGTIA